MKSKALNDQLMIRYLLGELDETEKNWLEEQYFTDDDCFEQLLVVKDELIDAYVNGELSKHESVLFEKNFLNSPQRYQQVEFAKSLRETIAKISPVDTAAIAKMSPQSASWKHTLSDFGQSVLDFFRIPNPAMAILFIGLTLGGIWLIVENKGVRNHFSQLENVRQELSQEMQQLRQQTAQQGARNEQLAEELQHEKRQRGLLEQALDKLQRQELKPIALSFVLSSGHVRDIDTEGIKKLIIPHGAHSVQFQLDLESEEEYKSYRAVLRTVEGYEIWSQDMLKARRIDSGKAVVLNVPSSIFSNDDYILTLRGLTAADSFEDVGSYHFSIIKP